MRAGSHNASFFVGSCFSMFWPVVTSTLGPFITSKPNSSISQARQNDILSKMSMAVVIGLSGTTQRRKDRHPIEYKETPNFIHITAGDSNNSNKHGGCTIYLNKKCRRQRHIVSHSWQMDPRLFGRGLAVRVKLQNHDLFPVCVCFHQWRDRCPRNGAIV